MEKFSKRNGIVLKPLTQEDISRLRSYSWPGNIRELQNVIERAVITSVDGTVNLEKALPDSTGKAPSSSPDVDKTSGRVLSDSELRELEKGNILRALEQSGWKVSGKNGAAELLGLPTSTLNSKIKSLGIKTPSEK